MHHKQKEKDFTIKETALVYRERETTKVYLYLDTFNQKERERQN